MDYSDCYDCIGKFLFQHCGNFSGYAGYSSGTLKYRFITGADRCRYWMLQGCRSQTASSKYACWLCLCRSIVCLHFNRNKPISLMEELKMRVCSTLSRFFVVLAGLFMVIGLAGTLIATEPASQSPEVVVPEPTTPTNLVSYNEYYVSAGTPTPAQKEAATTTAGTCVPGGDSCSSGCGGRCGHWLG